MHLGRTSNRHQECGGCVRIQKRFGFLLLAPIGLSAAGCGGSGATTIQNKDPVAVSVSSTVNHVGYPEITTNSTLPMFAAVVNTTNTAVTWSVSCGSPGQCGSIAAAANSDNATYSSPSGIPLNGEVTITATSAADSAKSGACIVVVTGSSPISVAWQSALPT